MALNDQDRRALVDIARRVRADDPELAAALTERPSKPPTVGAAIGLRVLAFVLIAVGTLTSLTLLIPAALVVFGIAHLFSAPTSSRPSPTPD